MLTAPGSMTPMLVRRVFAVLAAVFLVAAVALGSILPADEPCGEIIANFDQSWLTGLQSFELHWLGGWFWQVVTVPVLVRPAWLVPFALGLVCLGAVTTLNWMEHPSGSRRRRS
jgi:hypothetical protein